MDISKKKVKRERVPKTDNPDKKVEEDDDDVDVTNDDVEETIEKYKVFFKDLDSIKFEHEYERLKDMIKLNEQRQNKDKILSVLDDICYDTKIAGYLLVRVKKEYHMYEKLDYEIWMAQKRKEAVENGEFAKNASIEKIDDWIRDKYAESYKFRTEKLLTLKMVRDAMEIFYEQFNSRKTILQTQNKILGVGRES